MTLVLKRSVLAIAVARREVGEVVESASIQESSISQINSGIRCLRRWHTHCDVFAKCFLHPSYVPYRRLRTAFSNPIAKRQDTFAPPNRYRLTISVECNPLSYSARTRTAILNTQGDNKPCKGCLPFKIVLLSCGASMNLRRVPLVLKGEQFWVAFELIELLQALSY